MLSLHSLAKRRGLAYVRDCFGYLAIAATTAPLGLIAHRRGWGANKAFVLASSTVPPVAAMLIAAGQEAGPTGATPGKRHLGLQVTSSDGHRLSYGRALLRNAIKIAIPWQLGHTVSVGAAFDGFEEKDPLTLGATIVAYPLLAVLLSSVVFGEGYAIHDRLADSQVLPIRNFPASLS